MSDLTARCGPFLAAYGEWAAHKHAYAGQYVYWAGEEVELHGLESKPEYNGLRGAVDHYIPTKDRFSVRCVHNGVRVNPNVRPQNLRPVPLGPASTRQRIFDTFFRPGMRYFGTIQIPGDAGYRAGDVIGKRQTYELTIVGPTSAAADVDISEEAAGALGPAVLARHRAYEDEQFVFIRISQEETDGPAADVCSIPFSMQYSDAETTCVGTWDVSSKAFRGSVSQTVNSVDNILVKSDPVTHTFDLYPCHHVADNDDHVTCTVIASPSSNFLCNHRAAVAAALQKCLSVFQQTATGVDVTALGDCSGPLREEVQWSLLLQAASLQAEEVCAHIRLLAAFLDTLEFTSPVDRKNRLAELADKGGSRANIHIVCDKSINLVRSVLTWWYNIRPQEVESAVSLQVAAYRLNKSYERFNDSLRYASIRLTDLTLRQFSSKAAALPLHCDVTGLVDMSCCICMDNLHNYRDDNGEVSQVATPALSLPCSHSFHGDCIRPWLKFHAHCPICRVELREVEAEETLSTDNSAID